MKANSNQAVLQTLVALGAGMDVVSEGELRRARAAGVPGEQDHLLGRRQDAGARWRWGSTRTSSASTSNPSPSWRRCPQSPPRAGSAPRGSRIRVNPDVDARTHAKISTGKAENKFGIPISPRARGLRRAPRSLPGVEVTGVDMHIGSQITDLEPFDDAFALLADFVRHLRADGHAIDHVDRRRRPRHSLPRDNEPPPHPERYAEIVEARARERPRLRSVSRAWPSASSATPACSSPR